MPTLPWPVSVQHLDCRSSVCAHLVKEKLGPALIRIPRALPDLLLPMLGLVSSGPVLAAHLVARICQTPPLFSHLAERHFEALVLEVAGQCTRKAVQQRLLLCVGVQLRTNLHTGENVQRLQVQLLVTTPLIAWLVGLERTESLARLCPELEPSEL